MFSYTHIGWLKPFSKILFTLMYKHFLFFIFLLAHNTLVSQSNQWTFMKGDSAPPEHPIYGVQGLSSLINVPGPRQGSVSWTDTSGNRWLFGGNESLYLTDYLNDLWKYSPKTKEWVWLKGDTIKKVSGVYGTKEVSSLYNKPGARENSANWVDESGNLWLFGGFGYVSPGVYGYLNDLWKYSVSTNEWTWIDGDSTANHSAKHGTRGKPAASNNPGGRKSSTCWIDSAGKFWLFGGTAYASPNSGFVISPSFNDLWKYDPITKEWTWVSGANIPNSNGSYGTQGLFELTNTPGARAESMGWTDKSGNFWLFGGYGYGSSDFFYLGFLNDLWKYEIKSQQWKWVRGSKDPKNSGIHGIRGVSHIDNIPAGRRSSSAWEDSLGNFWILGGFNNSGDKNDLWKYNVVLNQWVWLKGDTTQYTLGLSGTLGMPAASSYPGAREKSASWSDKSGNILLFSGTNLANDLWKYEAQTNTWIWLNGATSNHHYGIYGNLRIEASTNKPGPREGSTSWIDKNGDFFLFGGYGYAIEGKFGALNDLWKYNSRSNQWKWIKGDTLVNTYPIYGTKGISASDNKPGGRANSISWADTLGNLYLFAGSGVARNGSGMLNDLWKYDDKKNEWTWIKGDSIANRFGEYGILRVVDTQNNPGGRENSISWIDESGNLWIFGGEGVTKDQFGSLNDLWKYDIKSNNWTWIHGDNSVNTKGDYGVKNKQSPINKPGGRYSSVGWKDKAGNFWLFGGWGYSDSYPGNLNDLWKYNITDHEWTWMKGDISTSVKANYGIKGTADENNKPSARASALSWSDKNGDMWLFGGNGIGSTADGGLNDLWKFNITFNNWTWVNGSKNVYEEGNFGIQGTTSAINKPGSSQNSVGWTDTSGNFWFFGGSGPIGRVRGFLNGLWKFFPNKYPIVTIISPLNGTSFPQGSSVALSVEAIDLDGSISKVEFFNHGIKFAEDATPPFGMVSTDAPPGNYSISAKAIDNEKDTANSNLVTIIVTSCDGTGKISADGFTNIVGSQISDLRSHHSFPSNPTVSLLLDKFEYGNNIGDNYGGMVRGYICAPQTGDYIFYIASDDQSELWISTDQNRSNKRKIAYLNWATFPRVWNLFPTQKSVRIRLTKGVKYYIEVLHKEGIGLDHMSVAWTLPNGVFEGPIDGSRLSPFEQASPNSIAPLSFGEAMEALTGFRITVRPNPSSNHFIITTKTDRTESITVTITDVVGRIVERRSNIAANGTIQVGNSFRKGVYFVEVRQGTDKQKLKLIRK